MKQKITKLNSQLMAVHRRFLANERQEAEKKMGKAISPYEFLNLLTGHPDFTWLRPFSTLIADVDAFVDETENITQNDALKVRSDIHAVLHDPQSNIAARVKEYLVHDPEFAILYTQFNAALNALTENH